MPRAPACFICKRRVRGGPEHAGPGDGEAGRRQDVADAQISGAAPGVSPVDSVERRVALVARICSSVGGGRERCSGAGGPRILQARIAEERRQGIGATVSVNGIEIGETKDRERRFGPLPEVSVEKAEPERGFIVVSAPVPVLGAVEYRRRGIPCHERQARAIGQDYRDHPVGRRGQSAFRRGAFRRDISGEFDPRESGEVAKSACVERHAREDRKCALPREGAEAFGIFSFAKPSVPVDVGACGPAPVCGARELVRIAAELFSQRSEGAIFIVGIDTRKDKNVGVGGADDLC